MNLRHILLFLSLLIFKSLSGQSTIGINETFIGGYGLQHELSISSHLVNKFRIGLKVGTNFKQYSSYKMGLRYSLFNRKKFNFDLGCDIGHLQYTNDKEIGKKGFRTFELTAALQREFSPNLSGLLEIGLLNKEFSSDPTPVLFRVGLAYKL